MEWSKLLSRERYGVVQPEKVEDGRSPFQKDIDRIIFSNAFRRLSHKTQVHPLPDNDHIHTRLTHSLEVSCVGRSLGTKVGEKLSDELRSINIEPLDIGAIVQAACLAHDIGNPPFGHSGEEAIRHWFKENSENKLIKDLSNQKERNDFIHFEGNAQGFRILTQIEYYLFEGGMQLTYATLGTFLKYPWTSDVIQTKSKEKYGCNQLELKVLEEITNKIGLIPRDRTDWCRHPLSYLMEAADDICYALIDLEDGLEMNLINYDEVSKILKHIIDFDELPAIYHSFKENDSDRRKIAIVRGKAMEVLVDGVVETFIREKDALLNGYFQYDDIIHACESKIQECIKAAKKIAREKIFNNPRKIQLEIGAYATIEILLDSFLNAAYHLHTLEDSESLSFKDRRILELMGTNKPEKEWSLYESYMRVIDYIAGMTDNYATYLVQQIRGMAK